MKIYAAKVCGIPDECCKRVCSLLDTKRREKAAALKHEKERLRSIYAGLLLRHAFLAQGYSQAVWQQIQIAQGSYGKPYLSNCGTFFYSLSHSGDWVICAVDDRETGADIQAVGKLKMTVAKRFYADEEYERLLLYASDTDRQTTELYRIWAAKESCVKFTGRGIGAGIERYVTDSAYTHIMDMEEGSRFFIRLYECIPNYIICVCSSCARFPEDIIITDIARSIFNMEGEKTC